MIVCRQMNYVQVVICKHLRVKTNCLLKDIKVVSFNRKTIEYFFVKVSSYARYEYRKWKELSEFAIILVIFVFIPVLDV